MSEPRKLYTGSASGGLDQEQYEAARRRAQQLAEQNARRRTVQQPMRTAQGRHISQRPAAQPAPEPVQEPIQEPVQQPAPQPEAPRELTYAQRQAMAYRAAAERKYGDTLQFQVQRPRRTVNRPADAERQARQAANRLYEQPANRRPAAAPRTQVRQMDLNGVQGSKPMYNYDAAAGGIQMEEAAPQAAAAAVISPRAAMTQPKPRARVRPAAKRAAKKAATARAARKRSGSAGGRSCLSRCWSSR